MHNVLHNDNDIIQMSIIKICNMVTRNSLEVPCICALYHRDGIISFSIGEGDPCYNDGRYTAFIGNKRAHFDVCDSWQHLTQLLLI